MSNNYPSPELLKEFIESKIQEIFAQYGIRGGAPVSIHLLYQCRQAVHHICTRLIKRVPRVEFDNATNILTGSIVQELTMEGSYEFDRWMESKNLKMESPQ